jgi:hypothetical protein
MPERDSSGRFLDSATGLNREPLTLAERNAESDQRLADAARIAVTTNAVRDAQRSENATLEQILSGEFGVAAAAPKPSKTAVPCAWRVTKRTSIAMHDGCFEYSPTLTLDDPSVVADIVRSGTPVVIVAWKEPTPLNCGRTETQSRLE